MAVKHTVETIPLSLYITDEKPIHVNRVSESFELAEHNHEFLEINYVSEGSGFHRIEGMSLPVARGDVFFLPLGVSHVFRPAHAQPKRKHLIVYNILFSTAFSRKLEQFFADDEVVLRFLTSPYPEQTWIHCQDTDGTFQSIVHTLFEEFIRKRPDHLQVMRSEMIRLLLHLRRSQYKAPAVGEPAPLDDPLEHVLDRIREKAAEPLTIQEHAAESGLSERQFRRRFEARTGMNYTEYVQKLRMELICKLLASTSETISSIAWKAGYRDIKFFNRLFKKLVGVTPTEYRKNKAQL